MGSQSVRIGAMGVAFLAIAGAGCKLSADAAGTRFRCAPGDPCPEGTSCSAEGYCEAMALSDAASTAPGDASVVCGTEDGVLSDGFDATAVNAALWAPYASANASATQQSGELRFALEASGQAEVVEYRSLGQYEIDNGQVTVHVGAVPSGTAFLSFAIEYADGERYAIRQRAGNTVIHWWPLGGGSTPETIHSEANDQYRGWRMRSFDDTLRFDMTVEDTGWIEVMQDSDRPPLPITVTLSLDDGVARETAATGSFEDIDSSLPCTAQ